MKKLRLIITPKCNRSCKGCCNKDFDLDNLPIIDTFEGYDLIMLTGGEPMLSFIDVLDVVHKIKQQNNKTKIVLYTAKVDILSDLYNVLNALDGITITLHNKKDVIPFILAYHMIEEHFPHLSLRLNIFKGIKTPDLNFFNWQVKDNIEWIKNCPLPKDEVLFKYLNID